MWKRRALTSSILIVDLFACLYGDKTGISVTPHKIIEINKHLLSE